MSQGLRFAAISQLLAVIPYISSPSSLVDAFSTSRPHPIVQSQPSQPPITAPSKQSPTQLHLSKIIDAEVIPEDEPSANPANAKPASTIIEYSQNQDPDWKSMPIAFCDTESNTYVDCNLAFYCKDPLGANIEGAEYALGVPCEVPIVVALELEEDENNLNNSDSDGQGGSVINLTKVIPINPDDNSEGSVMRDEEKEEIFQLAARALMEEFGKSIRMKKTPRVLTIEGNLEGAIGDWREVLLGGVGRGKKDKVSLDEVSDLYDDDEDEDYFDKIMRRDLGEDYEKLADDDDDMDEELLKLFDDPASEDGNTDLNDLMEEINTEEAKIKNTSYDQLVQQLQPSAALKLLNFLGPGGKEYTILRPLRPILLIGKEDPDDYTRRILLTEVERERILPRLESACREGLENAGFFLAGSTE